MEALGLIALYFLPTIIGVGRHHHNQNSIFVVNLLLGWTLIGWVVAMGWAVSAVNPDLQSPRFKSRAEARAWAEHKGQKTCPRCAETVKAEAKVCRFCGHEW